jgi:hypothetical protein
MMDILPRERGCWCGPLGERNSSKEEIGTVLNLLTAVTIFVV